MDLIGWYNSGDQSGGNLRELVLDGEDVNGAPIYTDEREVHKYYKKKANKWLNAFEPQYL